MVLIVVEETFRWDGDVFCVREAELAGAVGAEGVEGHDAFSLFLGGGVLVSVSVTGSILWGSIGGIEIVRSGGWEEDWSGSSDYIVK